MFVERRKLPRFTDSARERAKADILLASSRRLIAEIDVLLKRSRELTNKSTRQ